MIKQCRKFLMTMNNPQDKGHSVDSCLKAVASLKGMKYACAALEIGAKEHTPHIHLFVIYENPKLWKTMCNLIPKADWECCRGTSRQNRDYVFKLGKWIETEKGTTTVEGSQQEIGKMPEERSSSKPELELLYQLIQEGLSDIQIIDEYPEYMFDLSHIQRCRLLIRQDEYKDKWRDLQTSYIFGASGTGKSRYVMETYGYSNVFRVTDYVHPFDTYEGEDVIMFEEFNSSLRIQDMLNYLDGYPLKLPARYSDKQACFTKVFFTTNTPLENQYPSIKEEHKATWDAFIRRIKQVIWYKEDGTITTYDSTDSYLNRSEFLSVSEEEVKYIQENIF